MNMADPKSFIGQKTAAKQKKNEVEQNQQLEVAQRQPKIQKVTVVSKERNKASKTTNKGKTDSHVKCKIDFSGSQETVDKDDLPLVVTGIATRTKAAKQNDENVEDTRGDGVNADVDSDGVELLDYDDDLSFDDEVEEIQPRETADLSKSSDQHDYRNHDEGPSTSGVMQPDSDLVAQLAMHSEDKLLNNPVIQQLLEKQLSEEKLMNNLAIQNMMESFFKNI